MSDPGTTQHAAPAADADDWDQHWSQFSEAALANPAQAFRRRLIMAALAITAPRARVLDIGSGSGDLAADLIAELPEPRVLGVELSATGVEMSRLKVPQATFIECDLLADPEFGEHAGWAEYAVCSEVLEHVDDPVGLLRSAHGLMAPGCRLAVTVPGGPMSAFDRHIGHRRHFDVASLREVIAAAGLEPLDVRAAGFPVFNLYRLSVIAAGQRLVEAIGTSAEPRSPGRAVRAVAGVLGRLMRHNTRGRRLGFQMVGVARSPLRGD